MDYHFLIHLEVNFEESPENLLVLATFLLNLFQQLKIWSRLMQDMDHHGSLMDKPLLRLVLR